MTAVSDITHNKETAMRRRIPIATSFLVLAVTGLTSTDTQLVRAAYLTMNLLTRYIILPLSLVPLLLTGPLLSLGTPWGLFRHYWIVVKLVINLLSTSILVVHLQPISYLAQVAAERTLSSADRGVQVQLVAAAAAGLSVLFHAVPMLYMAVKFAGAAYLIWLGISMLRAKPREDVALAGIETRSGRRAFVESVTVEVLNPKTAIFFLAFLPQFIDASAGLPVWLQFVLLGTIVNLMFSFADVVCVALAGAVVARLRRSSHAQRLVQRAGGTMIIGLGVHLALQKS
jgi:threonine/homoserine/homoserine lactone efflux protein